MTVPASIQPCVKVLLIPELVHSIAHYLRPFERHRARLISQAFHVAFSPYIFLQLDHSLRVDTGDQTESICQKQLAALGYLVRKYSTKTTLGNTKEYDHPLANPLLDVALEQCHHIREVRVDWTGGDNPQLHGTPDLQAIFSGFHQLKILHLQMWRFSCMEHVLPLVARAKLAHLESLTLSAHRVYPINIISWGSLEEALDSCPSLRKLELSNLHVDHWKLKNPDWVGDYSLGPNEIPLFKTFPRIESLRIYIYNVSLTAKGLVFLSLCFPRLKSLEIDCGGSGTWQDALFDVEQPPPAPVNDQPIPELDPEAKYLNLPDLKRLKIAFSTTFDMYRAPWSLLRMVKQTPSLMSLEVNHVHWTVFQLRQMAEYCSKPEVNQSFERLVVNTHLTGRNTHWDLQSVLNLPCFHKLKELNIAKEAVLTKLLPKRHFHFASTLTTLRFGQRRVRFEHHILCLMNQHLLPNLPNLEVLTLDSKLGGYLLFRGLGFCPEGEERQPKAVMHQRYKSQDGRLVVTDLAAVQQDADQDAEPQAAQAQDVEHQEVTIEQGAPEDITVVHQDTTVDHIDAIANHEMVTDQQEVTVNHPDTTLGHTDTITIHETTSDHPEMAVEDQDVVNLQQEQVVVGHQEANTLQETSLENTGSASPEVDCMTDPITTTEEQAMDQLAVTMAKLGGLKHQDQDQDQDLDTATITKDLSECEPYHEHWHERERPFLRELDITFTGRSRITMDDVHTNIIRRFRLLETLTVEWHNRSLLNVKEWRARPEIRDDQRLAGMTVRHRMRGRIMP
ncbi:hypothetical protein MVEG_00452 [Podila verticillata NRRL 6337]|nr:hypothetical protein MVEG_00452 [Podila verticillata NRRL 6337]